MELGRPYATHRARSFFVPGGRERTRNYHWIMHRAPNPRRGVASQTSLKILSSWRFLAMSGMKGMGWMGGFFRGIFSRAAECKRRSRNVNLTTFSRRGESICLRALNALLEAAVPRANIYICTRPYRGCRKNSLNKAWRAFNQFFEAPTIFER